MVLLQYEPHQGILKLVRELNRLYRTQPALHELEHEPAGFTWLDADDATNSVLSFFRRGHDGSAPLLAVLNCTPVPREAYELGVPAEGAWLELLNTDSGHFGGSGLGNLGRVETVARPSRDQPHTLSLTLPPLAALLFEPAGSGSGETESGDRR